MRSTFLGFLAVMLLGCGVELGGDVADESVGTAETGLCVSGSWCVETAPIDVGTMLRSVWVADANNVFAVGDGGTILHRTGGAWSVMASDTKVTLKSVYGVGPTDVWAVGFAGTALHYDGVRWTPVSVGTSINLQAVWMSSSSDIWIAAASTLLHSTNGGASWQSHSKAGSFFAISGSSANHVLFTGENANVQVWNGSGFDKVIKPTTSTTTYFAIQALSPTNVWTSSFYPGKETLQNSGTSTWAARRTSIYNGGLFARSPSEIWGVGASKVGYWNGSAWTAASPLGTSAQLWGVHGTKTGTAGFVWVVGSNATIAMYTL